YSRLPSLQRFATHVFRWTTDQVLFTTQFEAARYRTLGNWDRVRQIIPIGSNVPTCPVHLPRDLSVIYFGQIRPGRGLEEFIELAKLGVRLSRPYRFSVVGSAPRKYSEYCKFMQE